MRARVFLLVVVTTLLVPGAASAKGPVAATVDGEGFDRPVELAVRDHSQLVEDLGFFSTVFRSEPDPTLDAAPAGDLGPRLEVAWEVPGPSGRSDVVRQDVYPLAAGGPVTYMAPGQAVMGDETYGGWFRAPAGLADDLAAAGIPAARAPAPDEAPVEVAAATATRAGGDGRSWTGPATVAAGAAAGGAGLALVLARRRAAPRA